MSTLVTIPRWLRFVNISAGIFIIILAILNLIFINGEIQTLIIVLAIALIIIGILRTINGIFQQYIEWYSRALKISIGILVIIIAVAVLALASIVPERIVSLLAVALIISSISRITTSSALTEYPTVFKVLTIFIGVITVVAAGIVLLFQSIAEPTMIVLLALTFIFNGAGWIYAGIKEIEEL